MYLPTMIDSIYVLITTAVIAWISGLVGAYIYRKGYTGQSVFEIQRKQPPEIKEEVWDNV